MAERQDWQRLATVLLEAGGDRVAGHGRPTWVVVSDDRDRPDGAALTFHDEPDGLLGWVAPDECQAVGVIATGRLGSLDSDGASLPLAADESAPDWVKSVQAAATSSDEARIAIACLVAPTAAPAGGCACRTAPRPTTRQARAACWTAFVAVSVCRRCRHQRLRPCCRPWPGWRRAGGRRPECPPAELEPGAAIASRGQTGGRRRRRRLLRVGPGLDPCRRRHLVVGGPPSSGGGVRRAGWVDRSRAGGVDG